MKKLTKVELSTSAQKVGFVECRKVFTKLMFLAFLRPEVRVWVEANGIKDDTTLEDIRVRAIDADHALRAKMAGGATSASSSQMSALKLETEEFRSGTADRSADQCKQEISCLQRQLNAMNVNKPSRGTRGGGQAGRGRGGGGSRGGLGNTSAIPARKRWVLCHKCRQWGLHYQSECGLSEEEIRRLAPQSGADEPTGAAFDTQFPN